MKKHRQMNYQLYNCNLHDLLQSELRNNNKDSSDEVNSSMNSNSTLTLNLTVSDHNTPVSRSPFDKTFEGIRIKSKYLLLSKEKVKFPIIIKNRWDNEVSVTDDINQNPTQINATREEEYQFVWK